MNIRMQLTDTFSNLCPSHYQVSIEHYTFLLGLFTSNLKLELQRYNVVQMYRYIKVIVVFQRQSCSMHESGVVHTKKHAESP